MSTLLGKEDGNLRKPSYGVGYMFIEPAGANLAWRFYRVTQKKCPTLCFVFRLIPLLFEESGAFFLGHPVVQGNRDRKKID